GLRPGPPGPRRGPPRRGPRRGGRGGGPDRAGPDRGCRALRTAQGGHGLGLLVGRGQGVLTRQLRGAPRTAAARRSVGGGGGGRLTPGHNGVAPTFTAHSLVERGDPSGKRATYLHV